MSFLKDLNNNQIKKYEVDKKLKCPRCKKTPSRIYEECQQSVSFEIEENKVNISDGYVIEKSSAKGVYAECDECDHAWRLRKKSTIDCCLKIENKADSD